MLTDTRKGELHTFVTYALNKLRLEKRIFAVNLDESSKSLAVRLATLEYSPTPRT